MIRYSIIVMFGATVYASFLACPAGCAHADRPSLHKAKRPWVELQGAVVRKTSTKSLESWNAGSAEYYVLDVGDAPIERRSAREGVILRPTENVPFEAFAKFTGSAVVVKGRFVEGKPFVPSDDSVEAYPMAPEPGKPLLRGGGFEVHDIESASVTRER